MATLVSLHAHPDDECIACGGMMRKAFEDGHRVVLVVATCGERGEVAPGVLHEDETLSQRRVAETEASAGILGVGRLEFLDYVDSGMMGASTNTEPGSFWTAGVEQAAQQVAAILREERADVLTCYDDNGGYGHPDHIQVHRVGMRAAQIAGTERVYQNTTNRDHMLRGITAFGERAAAAGIQLPDASGIQELGKPESLITTAVDVSPYIEYKRQAMRAHASQIDEQSFFLTMPEDGFRYVFGTEWFIRAGQEPGITETDLFGSLHRSI